MALNDYTIQSHREIGKIDVEFIRKNRLADKKMADVFFGLVLDILPGILFEAFFSVFVFVEARHFR